MHRSKDHITITVLASLTLGSMLASGYFLLSSEGQDLEQLARVRIEERALRAELKLMYHFKPIIGFLRIVQDWGAQGLAPVEDTDLTAIRLSPILNRIPNALSFELGEEDGFLQMRLVRDGGQWVNDASVTRAQRAPAAVTGVVDHQRAEGSIEWKRLLDERGRFYRASIEWNYETRVWEAAVNIGQRGFDDLATSLAVGSDLDVVWLSGDGNLVRLSGAATEGESGISSSLILEPVRKALTARESESIERVFSLEGGDDRAYVGAIRELEIERDRFRFCVVADQKVLLQDLQGSAWTTIYVLLTLSGLGLVGLLVTGARVLRQRRAAAQSKGYCRAGEEELLDLIQSGESERLEFKSTMRWNVRADRPGKEVELSWLTAVAAFLNSSGGTLLIGVADDGNPTGIEADKFPNEDRFLLHFNNLIKEYIGLEFTRLIDFEIRTVAGVRIMVLDCQPSGQPVFLKKGNQEEFFIRVGPGSRKLSASEMLEFLKGR